MSKATLKRELKSLTKEEIIDVVLELYDARKEAKEYLEYFLTPNEEAELKRCKAIIFAEFYPKRGESKMRFALCRKTISDFKKLKPSPDILADLMLYYIEVGIEHTLEFGDMWEQYYIALENNFGKELEHISKNCNPGDCKIRIKEMVDKVYHCGWGFYDGLSYFYEQYYTE